MRVLNRGTPGACAGANAGGVGLYSTMVDCANSRNLIASQTLPTCLGATSPYGVALAQDLLCATFSPSNLLSLNLMNAATTGPTCALNDTANGTNLYSTLPIPLGSCVTKFNVTSGAVTGSYTVSVSASTLTIATWPTSGCYGGSMNPPASSVSSAFSASTGACVPVASANDSFVTLVNGPTATRLALGFQAYGAPVVTSSPTPPTPPPTLPPTQPPQSVNVAVVVILIFLALVACCVGVLVCRRRRRYVTRTADAVNDVPMGTGVPPAKEGDEVIVV